MSAFDAARAEPETKEGAFMPLFDLLADENPQDPKESTIRRVYSKEELIESVEREISNLLNTRTTATKKNYTALGGTILNFGLPEMYGLIDFSKVDGTSQQQWEGFSRLVEKTISFYEPRVTRISAVVLGYDRQQQELRMHLKGDVKVGKIMGYVSFPIQLSLSR